MQNTLIQCIVEYIKETTLKYPDFEKLDDKIKKMLVIYDDLENIYTKYDKSLKQLTKSQINTFNKIYENIKIDMNSGGSVIIYAKSTFISNVAKISLFSLYPNIIKLFYLNGKIDNCHMYSYIVENKNIINDYLETEEQKLMFRLIINYKFGILHKQTNNVVYEITAFARQLFDEIILLDKYDDIIYIDTDSLYYYYNKDFYNKIFEFLNNLFIIDNEGVSTYLFLDKKKYVEIKDVNSIRMKGLQYDTKWKNKDVKNFAYDLYCKNNDDLTYNQFICVSKNRDIRQSYLIKSSQIINRTKKLERICND